MTYSGEVKQTPRVSVIKAKGLFNCNDTSGFGGTALSSRKSFDSVGQFPFDSSARSPPDRTLLQPTCLIKLNNKGGKTHLEPSVVCKGDDYWISFQH